MSRLYLPLPLMLLMACSGAPVTADSPPTPTFSATAPSSFVPSVKDECREGAYTAEYGCPKSMECAYMMSDVREMKGFHVVSVEQCECGTHPTHIHVADTCQHYFCAVDKDCFVNGGTAESCMQPKGCMLVHKL